MNGGAPAWRLTLEKGPGGIAALSRQMCADIWTGRIRTMAAEEAKKLIRRMVEDLWQRRNPDAIREYFDHKLQEGASEHYEQLIAAFPDLSVKVEDMFAEGDKVFVRLEITGTHTSAFAGRPPTGKSVSWASARTYRVADGRIVETWAMQDRLSLMQQVGAAPPVEGVNWASPI